MMYDTSLIKKIFKYVIIYETGNDRYKLFWNTLSPIDSINIFLVQYALSLRR